MIFLIMKDGYYYRHNSQGYTSSPMEAELFDEQYAKNHAEVVGCLAIPLKDAVRSVEYIADCIERLEAMKEEFTLAATKESEQ